MQTPHIGPQRAPRIVMLLAGWLALSAVAWAASSYASPRGHTPGFNPVFAPLAWHREHWRQRRHFEPSFTVELPWALFDPYHTWGLAPRPAEPARPEARPRERGDMWRDDVVGSGSGDRFEVHPEGRILRSRPRPD